MIAHKEKNIFLLLAIVTIAVFTPTFFNDFQKNWDDQWMLLNNPFVLDFSLENMWYHINFFYHGQYSPVNTLLYGLIYQLDGFNPAIYHGFCLLVHVLNVFLAFLIVKACVSRVKRGFNNRRLNVYAGGVALLFAIHPLQVETVAWISASKVILYSFFTLAGLWGYLRYIQTGKRRWLMGVGIAYVLGFASKEQAILFPLLLLAVDWIYGRFKTSPFTFKIFTQRVYLEKLPFMVLAAGMWYFSWQNNLGNISVDDGYPLYQRLLFGNHSLIQYIFRFIAPVKLYYFYFFPMNVGEAIPPEYWIYPLLTVIVILFVLNNLNKNNRLVVFGALFFVLNLLLVLHLLPMPRKMITADRYMYLSIIGVGLVLVWLVDYLQHRFVKHRNLIIGLSVLFLITLGIQSSFRTREWKDSATIKRNIRELVEKRAKQDEAIVNNPLKEMNDEEQ